MKPLPLLALLLGGLIVLPAHAATAADLEAQGRTALFRGELDRAEKLLLQATQLEPNNARHHYYLGATYGEQAVAAGLFSKGSLANKARSEFERAVALDPNYVDARLALIDFYTMAPGFMGGSDEKALAQAAEIAKRNKLQGHRARARIYSRDKKPDLAKAEYVAGVREAPTSAQAHYYLGTFLIGSKAYDEGVREIDAALKLDPAYMPSHFRIGVYAGLTGKDTARGEESLKKYLAATPAENEPRLEFAWYWLGMVYEKQGKKNEARNAYLQARQLAPNMKEAAEALKRVQ